MLKKQLKSIPLLLFYLRLAFGLGVVFALAFGLWVSFALAFGLAITQIP